MHVAATPSPRDGWTGRCGDAAITVAWAAVAAADAAPWWHGLDDVEGQRAARLVHACDRDRFAAARRLARALAAATLAVDPAAVTFGADAAGRPLLSVGGGEARGWDIGWSHSGDRVVCAVGRNVRLGVDVEATRRLPDALALADATMTAGEREAIAAAAESAREIAFLRHWTLKEAWSKARGDGLAAPLRDHGAVGRLPMVSGGAPVPVAWDAPPLPGHGAWRLFALAVGPDHVAALAIAPLRPARGVWSWR